jgi:hypothetical protein
MLGARTAHEWAHVAVDAGWVPCTASSDRFAGLLESFALELDRVIAGAPRAVRDLGAADLDDLAAHAPTRRLGGSNIPSAAASALVDIFVTRLGDYRANLVATHLMTPGERETYVRHNVRTLRKEYPRPRLWRMLVRYLYEYQYLSFSQVSDPFTFFTRSTWFDADFFTSGILDEDGFLRLSSCARAICTSFALDETRFVFAHDRDLRG